MLLFLIASYLFWNVPQFLWAVYIETRSNEVAKSQQNRWSRHDGLSVLVFFFFFSRTKISCHIELVKSLILEQWRSSSFTLYPDMEVSLFKLPTTRFALHNARSALDSIRLLTYVGCSLTNARDITAYCLPATCEWCASLASIIVPAFDPCQSIRVLFLFDVTN